MPSTRSPEWAVTVGRPPQLLIRNAAGPGNTPAGGSRSYRPRRGVGSGYAQAAAPNRHGPDELLVAAYARAHGLRRNAAVREPLAVGLTVREPHPLGQRRQLLSTQGATRVEIVVKRRLAQRLRGHAGIQTIVDTMGTFFRTRTERDSVLGRGHPPPTPRGRRYPRSCSTAAVRLVFESGRPIARVAAGRRPVRLITRSSPSSWVWS